MAIKNFNIGEMRTPVVFMINNPNTAQTGGATDSYDQQFTTRGRLRKMNGNRSLTFGEILNSESYELICRFQQRIEDLLRVDTKVMIGNKTYSMDSWEVIDQIRFYYRFILKLQKQDDAFVP